MTKSDQIATTIGEETLGGCCGHTGHKPVTYELPDSKFQITFSIVDHLQDVGQSTEIAFGQGVIPDNEITLSMEGLLHRKDPHKDFAKQLI